MAEPHNGPGNVKAVEINDCDAFHEEREEKVMLCQCVKPKA